MKVEDLKDSLTPQDAAKLLKYSVSHIRWLVQHHRLKAVKIGRRIFIHRDSLDALIEEVTPENEMELTNAAADDDFPELC